MRPVEGLRGTAMVTRGGSVEADLAEGLADVEAGVPCTPATKFQLCSVSKQFTAVAVMLLAESGQLDLREPVGQWLPEGPPQWRRVALHQLLSHTFACWIPDRAASIVILANDEAVSITDLVRQLLPAALQP
jgi:CubicO group peptidase (beta-lactamase class C family)